MPTITKTYSKSENSKAANCFLCYNRITNLSRNGFNIFDGRHDTTVVNLQSMLKRSITEIGVHSQYLCKNCKGLCEEYEELIQRMEEIRTVIQENYLKSISNLTVNLGIVKSETILDAPIQSTNDKVAPIQSTNDQVEEICQSIVELPSSEHLVEETTAADASEFEQTENIIVKGKNVVFVSIKTPPERKIDTETVAVKNDVAQYFDENDANMVEICTESNFEDFLDEQTIETIVDENGLSYDADGNLLSIENEIETNEMEEIIDEIDMKNMQTDESDEMDDTKIDINDGDGLLAKIEQSENESKHKPMFIGSGDQYICQLCSDSSIVFDVGSITTHLRTQHQIRAHICDICGMDFCKRSELNTHLNEHIKKEDGHFKCEICSRIFNNLRLYRLHKRMHTTKVKSWTCEECNKKYSSKNLLDEHMNMHTGDRPYKCQMCSKDFASKYTLTAHLKIHTERERPYKCNACSKSFFSIQNLSQHERTHSGVKEFACDICDKAFGTLHNLDVHKIVHTGYKPFICRTCGKAFARRAEIKDHERTHTGEKPYECETCGSKFAQRSNLMSHKRATHLNDKRYKCDICEKSFKRRRLLDYHKKATHTGERPYKCETCDSTFVYPEHYKKHLRIHTGVKPFKCEVCGKAFNSRDNRNAHRFVHSEKKPYECVFCGQGFMRKPLLLAHMEQQNHKNEVIITNHAQISVTIADAVEYLDDDDPKQEKSHITEYLHDNDDEDDDDDDDDPLDGEIIEEQHIIEEDDSDLIIDGQVQFSESSQDPNVGDHNQYIGPDLEEIAESVFITEETEMDDDVDNGSSNNQNSLMQVQVTKNNHTSWMNLVSR